VGNIIDVGKTFILADEAIEYGKSKVEIVKWGSRKRQKPGSNQGPKLSGACKGENGWKNQQERKQTHVCEVTALTGNECLTKKPNGWGGGSKTL